jgi:fructosamine-3-kinase
VTWKTELANQLGARITSVEPVSGGDINDAYRVRLDDHRVVFVKTHAKPPAGMYQAEATGLAWLRPGPLRVPNVLVATASCLALEWLELTPKGRGFDEALGRGLAGLHQLDVDGFGFHSPSFLATLPQDNTRTDDGARFWIERRVRPLCEQARRSGTMPDVREKLDALRAKPDRFGPPEPPSRLHGDLWWGNVVAVDGAPCLIDPAVYGGHREVDLAMLAVFGGVSPALIAAYEEVSPLAAGCAIASRYGSSIRCRARRCSAAGTAVRSVAFSTACREEARRARSASANTVGSGGPGRLLEMPGMPTDKRADPTRSRGAGHGLEVAFCEANKSSWRLA